MRTVHWKLPALLVVLAMSGPGSPAFAAGGASLAVGAAAEGSSGSPWQGRIAYGGPAPLWRSGLGGFESGGFTAKQARGPSSLNLLGDYFFAPSFPAGGAVGGFRATSGILIGTRSQLSFSQPALPGGLFASSGRIFGSSTLPYGADAGVEPLTLPYMGVGYTALSPGSGWRFSADLGWVGSGASNAASRLFGGGQRGLDDLAHDVRPMPLVQVGVQYSF